MKLQQIKNRNLTFPAGLMLLLLAPTVAAECVQQCDPEEVAACAQGLGSGSAAAGGAVANCWGIQIITQVNVNGNNTACSAQAVGEANSCDGKSNKPHLLDKIHVIMEA